MKDTSHNVLIGKTLTPTVGPTVANIQNGEILILNGLTMAELAAGATVATAPFIYIVQGTENVGRPIWSPPIQGVNVENWSGKSYAAATQQVTHVGNVGSGALAIVAQNETEYQLTIILDNNTQIYQERPNFRRYNYTTDASATQQEIADAFVALINNDAYTNDYITAATVSNAGNYGIQLTGKAPTFTQRLPMDYQVLRFTVTTDLGFATTPVTATTAPNPGKGSFPYVAEMERKTLHNTRGISNHTVFPAPGMFATMYADSATTYDEYIIAAYHRHDSNSIETNASENHLLISLFLPEGASAQRTKIEARLNPWMATAGKGPGGYATVTL